MDYGQLPSSAALYPHMSESKRKGRARRIRRSSDFWIPRVDADVLYRLLSGNNHRVSKVTTTMSLRSNVTHRVLPDFNSGAIGR